MTELIPPPNSLCPICQSISHKSGKTKAGSQRYRCSNLDCDKRFTDSDNPWGSKPKGDKAMTGYERLKKFRKRNGKIHDH